MLENNSIAHHTSSVSTLNKILKAEAFKVQYCTERIYVNKSKSVHIAVPMVSFADIRPTDYVRAFWKPKSDDTPRLGYYGDYAIGLSKDWATKKNVMPIIYVPKSKEPGDVWAENTPIAALKAKAKKNIDKRLRGKLIRGLPPIASFCKHYVGVLEKEEESTRNIIKIDYSFHLEQEWRFVSGSLPVLWNFYNKRSDADFEEKKQEKRTRNKEINERLNFDIWEDVTYIVVRDSAVSKILEILKRKYEAKMTLIEDAAKAHLTKRYNYLCSSIVTTEQLLNNL